ncbi:MAG: hypothetical protein QM765_08425 [Myxococcales bacterium]
MMLRQVLVVVLMCASLAAVGCGGGDPKVGGCDAGDGGLCGSPNPNGSADAGSTDVGPTLRVVVPFGIALKPEHRLSTEKPVEGTLVVEVDNKDVTDAVVKVNGTLVPYSTADLFSPGYALEGTDLALAPGQKAVIDVTVANPAKSLSFTIECPPDFSITSPADGSAVQGAPLKVTWSPGVAIKSITGLVPAPVAGQYACKDKNGTFSRAGTGDWFKKLEKDQTEVTLDDVDDNCDLSLIEVRTSGNYVYDDAGSSGICFLHHRVSQVKP